jgi:RHS repeat-associated protein
LVTEKTFKCGLYTNLLMGYSYDNEGKMTSVGHPAYWTDDPQNPGQVIYMQGSYYQIFYDSLGRPNQMIEHDMYTNWQYMDVVKEVNYGSVGELLSLKRKADEAGQLGSAPFLQEAFQYNNRFEMIRHTVTPVGSGTPVWDATYQHYSNGQIWKASDPMGGENVYTYDTLGRLTTAANAAGGTNYPARGLSFSYDGFGNRLSQTVTLGSGPNVTIGVNPATNRISDAGYSYDANGNLTNAPWATYGYDIDNRLVSVSSSDTMKYDHENRRYYRKKSGSNYEELFLYGAYGELLMKLHPINSNWSKFVSLGKGVYFAGRMIKSPDGEPVQDRVGSVTYNRFGDQTTATSRFFPYGEKVNGSGGIGDVQFGTYRRDLQNDSTLDYADQRFYQNKFGRFLTPDPYGGSAKPESPQSWNRYAYANNDPINDNDPTGLEPRDTPRSLDSFTEYWYIKLMLPRPMLLRPDPPTRGSWGDALSILNNAKSAILNKKKYSTDCTKIFDRLGISINSIKDLLKPGKQVWKNGNTSNDLWYMIMPEGDSRDAYKKTYGTAFTVSDAFNSRYFYPDPILHLATAQLGGNKVYWNPDAVTDRAGS